MVVPKYTRPVKTGNTWVGLTFNDLPGHPTKVEYPWKYHCPAPLCFMVIHAATEDIIDERIRKHPCPWYGGGTTTLSWGVMSDNYLAPIWEKLDAEVDIMKGIGRSEHAGDDEIREDMQAARYRAGAYAETLAILMPPFFSTKKEIVNEALVRHENRVAGVDYETPGLGRLRYKVPVTSRGDVIDEYDPAAPKKAPPNSLTEIEIANIKKSKTFPIAMLMSAYGVDRKVIEFYQSQED